jgi:Uma2 family endonuclease
MAEWDLEYMLLFGPPENKLELIDGITPCSFPFADREVADSHFAHWAATLARWQDLPNPPASVEEGMPVKRFNRFALKQYRRPIRLEVPSQIDAYDLAHGSFWDRSRWPMQPAGFATGYEWSQDHWDIKMNLWRIFEDAKKELGLKGYGIGGCDISLTEVDAVQPDYFIFRTSRQQCMIENSYFAGVPDLAMEVVSPFSRAIDRGERKEVYRRAGLKQLWLLDPLTRMIELYLLSNGEYRLEATAGLGDTLPVPGFDGVTIAADRVFDLQSDRWKDSADEDEPAEVKPKNPWAIAPDQVVGLQHLILLGHAERRREIWNNQSPCFLAFNSAEEARHRLDRFLLEAARWENMRVPIPTEIEPDLVVADVGRFHFLRQGHVVRLNVDVSGLLYRELLRVTADRKAWDWGEDE